MSDGPYVIRERTDADNNFILSSWINSFKPECQYYDGDTADRYRHRGIKRDAVKRFHSHLVQRMIERNKIVVAAMPEDPTIVFGFACADRMIDRVLHYVFVKDGFRRWGVGSGMIKAFGWPDHATITMSHWTPPADFVLTRSKRWRGRFEFNPYLRFV